MFKNYDSAIFSRSNDINAEALGANNNDNPKVDGESGEAQQQQQVRKRSRSARKSNKEYISILRGPKGIPRLWEEMPKHTRLRGKGYEVISAWSPVC